MRCWYHSDRGYWETRDDVDQRYIDQYPSGTVEVPQRPVRAGCVYDWNGSAWVEYDDMAVPVSVTKYQFMVALNRSGQLANVRAALQNAGVSDEARIYWEAAIIIERNSLLIAAIQGEMELSDAQVDAFFRSAAKIE